jgi:hypothetical protein
MSEVGRPETEAKKNKKFNSGIRNMNILLGWMSTSDSCLPSLSKEIFIKITVEPYLFR